MDEGKSEEEDSKVNTDGKRKTTNTNKSCTKTKRGREKELSMTTQLMVTRGADMSFSFFVDNNKKRETCSGL